jgi:hypothetical protein
MWSRAVLEIVMTIITSSDRIEMFGKIGNVSNLAATSSYVAWVEGCGEVRLDGYPRWCEPVRGLLARCLELTEPGKPLPADWVSVRVDIGLNGGGLQRRPTRLAMCRIERRASDIYSVGWVEGSLRGFIEVQPRAHGYPDACRLAQHALNVSVWNVDEIPQAQPLVVPVYDNRYMRTSDLPEPARSAFEYRQRHSGRPCIWAHWDACWIWDWEDFQSGQRGWW